MSAPPVREPDKRLHLLLSPGFILCLTALILNDHIAKAVFHNWLTGKISDVAGLFAFALFWCAVAPRWKRSIFVAILACFMVWKTELSDPIIHLFNRSSMLAFDRVVDYSDLLALSVLPLAFWYERRPVRPLFSEAMPLGVAVLSVFAFMATSRMHVIEYEDPLPTYIFSRNAWETLTAINEHFDPDPLLSFSLLDALSSQKAATTTIRFKDSCLYNARIIVKSRGDGSEISLMKANHHCQGRGGKFDETVGGKDGPVSDAFEKVFIESLREILISRRNEATSGVH